VSDSSGGSRQFSRRKYLKGLAAVGVTASLAGCIDLGSYESSISAYDPDWASETGYTDADHRRDVRNFRSGADPASIQASFGSHAVTYSQDDQSGADGEQTNAAGTFTTPTGGDIVRGFNPFVGQTIDELLQGDAARLLLDGLGINVASDWSWADGPTVESPNADDVSLYGQRPDDYALVHGVVRTGSVSRPVLIVAGRRERERDGDDEIILTGLSMQQIVEEGAGSADFRSEHGDQLIEEFESSVGTVREINPETDLADFE
jgi:hypothetical protein